MLPSTPAATIPIRVRLPCETLNPANNIVASLGIGMQALSRTMRTKTPASPVELIRSVAALTSGPRRSAVIGGGARPAAGGAQSYGRDAHRRPTGPTLGSMSRLRDPVFARRALQLGVDAVLA